MPKLKSKSSAKKRFLLRRPAKVRGNVAYKKHFLSRRSRR